MIHEWAMCDLNSESYFWVLLIFFVFSGMLFVWTGRRVWVHIAILTRRSVHTIYYKIYTFYIQILGGLFAFLWDFMFFILITSLQERGQAAPYPIPRHCNMYSAICMDDDDMMDGKWKVSFFWKILSPISKRVFAER